MYRLLNSNEKAEIQELEDNYNEIFQSCLDLEETINQLELELQAERYESLKYKRLHREWANSSSVLTGLRDAVEVNFNYYMDYAYKINLFSVIDSDVLCDVNSRGELKFKQVDNLNNHIQKLQMLGYVIKKQYDKLVVLSKDDNFMIISSKPILIQQKLRSENKRLFMLKSFTKLDLSNTYTNSLTMLFDSMKHLKNLNLGNMKLLGPVRDTYGMCAACDELESIDFGNLDTSKITNISFTFAGCKSLRNVNFRDIDLSNVKDYRAVFSQCNQLEKLDISKNNFRLQNTVQYIFGNIIFNKELEVIEANETKVFGKK